MTFEARAWRVVIVLMAATVFSYIDRFVLGMLIQEFHRDYHFSDTQMGVLVGLPFAIFYAVAGLPIGRLLDRYNRMTIVSIGILLWCVATTLCSFATSYAELMILRIAVAVGEAVLVPAAYPMIADSFPGDRFGVPSSVFACSSYAGNGLAYILGGAVLSALSSAPFVHVPLVGVIHGWQLTFAIVGIPGLLVAVVAFFTPDPTRSGRQAAAEVEPRPSIDTSLRSFASFLLIRRRAFLTIATGVALMSAAFSAVVVWMPTLMLRDFQWSSRETGVILGTILLVATTTGSLVAGRLSDLFIKMKVGNRLALAAAVAPLAVALSIYLILKSAVLVLMGFGFLALCLAMAILSGPLSIQEIAPASFRALTTALYILVVNVGFGLGPILPPLMSDYLFRDRNMIGDAMAVVVIPILIVAGLVMAMGLPSVTSASEASRLSKADEQERLLAASRSGSQFPATP